jgi:hypothetical protein
VCLKRTDTMHRNKVEVTYTTCIILKLDHTGTTIDNTAGSMALFIAQVAEQLEVRLKLPQLATDVKPFFCPTMIPL